MAVTNNTQKNEKPKREYTTKQLIVSGKHMLECLAYDNLAEYPATLITRDKYGSASIMIQNPEEALSMSHSWEVYGFCLTRLSNGPRGMHIELEKDGKITVDKNILPKRRHMDTLLRSQAQELYNNLMHPDIYPVRKREKADGGETDKTISDHGQKEEPV